MVSEQSLDRIKSHSRGACYVIFDVELSSASSSAREFPNFITVGWAGLVLCCNLLRVGPAVSDSIDNVYRLAVCDILNLRPLIFAQLAIFRGSLTLIVPLRTFEE